MKCQFCGKNDATIHVTNVIGNDVQKIHICQDCAETKGFDNLKKSNFEKNGFLAGLVDSSLPEKERQERRCGHCGRTYAAFSKSAGLGCSKCYDSFGDDIERVLKRIHGNARHLGKSPRRYCTEKVNARRRIRALEDELRISVDVENYERAARLRDEIADLRKGMETR
ncbi:MAG: UvrB/UvrC motif-containing protein [Candidatus Krumholzibacteria bacterium]|nr:UvrB/UvrC motif-containing protein [Candidatus Krumholzibacteria bacterium]